MKTNKIQLDIALGFSMIIFVSIYLLLIIFLKTDSHLQQTVIIISLFAIGSSLYRILWSITYKTLVNSIAFGLALFAIYLHKETFNEFAIATALGSISLFYFYRKIGENTILKEEIIETENIIVSENIVSKEVTIQNEDVLINKDDIATENIILNESKIKNKLYFYRCSGIVKENEYDFKKLLTEFKDSFISNDETFIDFVNLYEIEPQNKIVWIESKINLFRFLVTFFDVKHSENRADYYPFLQQVIKSYFVIYKKNTDEFISQEDRNNPEYTKKLNLNSKNFLEDRMQQLTIVMNEFLHNKDAILNSENRFLDKKTEFMKYRNELLQRIKSCKNLNKMID